MTDSKSKFESAEQIFRRKHEKREPDAQAHFAARSNAAIALVLGIREAAGRSGYKVEEVKANHVTIAHVGIEKTFGKVNLRGHNGKISLSFDGDAIPLAIEFDAGVGDFVGTGYEKDQPTVRRKAADVIAGAICASIDKQCGKGPKPFTAIRASGV